MKKSLLLGAALLAVLTVSSCGEKAPKDEIAPVISGNQDIVCSVNETVDLLNGLVAVDETDGDISENITVTLLPEITVTDGKVTPTETGDYEIQYEVKDKAGNIAKAYAELAVNPALAEKVSYKKYEFANGEIAPFGSYFNTEEGIVGSADFVKGNYQLNVQQANGTDWHIKFDGNIATTVGVDYKLTYKFVSSVAGKVMANGNAHDIVVGTNEVSYSFTADGEGKYVELQFGLLTGPFTIDMISVNVEESVGTDVFTDITPQINYQTEGVVYSAFDNNSAGEHSATENSATLNITRGSDDNGCWQSKLFIKPGMDLAAGKYKISLDVHSTNGHKFEICFNSGDVEKGVGALYGLELAADESKTFDYTFTLDSAKDNLVILLQLGELKTPQGNDVVTVSNIKIESITGDKTVTSKGYSFGPLDFGTYNDAASAEGYLYVKDSKLVYEMTKIATIDWHNKMYIEKILLEADKIYTVTFTAKADKNISCAFFVNPCGTWDPRLSQTVNFTTEVQEYSFTMSAALMADMNFELLWQFGSGENANLGSAVIEFSNIEILAQDVQ